MRTGRKAGRGWSGVGNGWRTPATIWKRAQLTVRQWRERWDAARMFLSADGESGKRYGNETIRITAAGRVSIKLPVPLAHLANAPHGRYTLACTVVFGHRGDQWRDRIDTNAAVAYTIHHDPDRDRWYVTAAWQRKDTAVWPIHAALAAGCIGVDTNDDHLAAWRLDPHGNPIGQPRRFFYNLAGTAAHRDAQIRHALTRLLHWARHTGVGAIAVEDLDFSRQQDPREARPQEPVAAPHLPLPHCPAAHPPRLDGRRGRHRGSRGRPGLHHQMGRRALA